MYRHPLLLLSLVLMIAVILFLLGEQRAHAAPLLNVTADGHIVAGSLANECNSPCSATYTLTVNIVGSGSVGKQPEQSSYLHGTLINLTATAAEGFVFSGWSGACVGRGVCSVMMESAQSVTATFDLIAGDPNDLPSLVSVPVLNATAGANYTYFVVASDPDAGDLLTLSAPGKPTWLALIPAGNGTATLTGTPGAQDIGAHLMRLRVEDASGASATQTFILIVAPAPATTSSIQGSVVDEEGNAIGGARVTLLADGGNVAGTAANSHFTDSNGVYLFADVQPGDYTITARMNDQAPATLIAVTVMPGQPVTVSSITLQPGQLLLRLPMVGK